MRLKVAIIFQLIFYLFLIAISFFAVDGKELLITNMDYADLALIIMMILSSYLIFKYKVKDEAANSAAFYIYFIIFYSFISVLWASNIYSYTHLFYQILLAFLTISIPYNISKIKYDINIDYRKWMSNVAAILSIAFLIYLFWTEEGNRLAGPIGTSAILSVVILPVFSIHLYNLFDRYRLISSSLFLIISTISIFATQSRAGLIILVLFLTIIILSKPSLKKVASLISMIFVFIYFYLDKIDTRRYENLLSDKSRSTAFDSAINWWLDSPISFIFGNGYGSLWQWSLFDSNKHPYWNKQWTSTENGNIMYHAHSVISQVIAELGLVGLIAFILFIVIIFRETIKSWKAKEGVKTYILISLLCTLPIFHADLMVFRNWEVSLIWFFFLFSALRHSNKHFVKASR